MTRVLLLATIVMSLAAAFLSYRTKDRADGIMEEKRRAVADSQKQKLEVERLSAAQKEAESKKDELTKGREALVEDAAKAREELKAKEGQMEQAKAQAAEKAAEMAKLQERLKAAEEKMATMSAPGPNPEADAKVADLTVQLQRSQLAAAQLEKSSQSMAAQVEDLKKKVEIEKKKAQKAEKKRSEEFVFGDDSEAPGKSRLASGAGRSGSGQKKAAAAEDAEEEKTGAKSEDADEDSVKAKLEEKLRRAEGQIVRLDAGWNLVVVNLGDADGVTLESPMQVLRGGQVVANLRIAKVEAKRFTATVIAPEGKRRAEVNLGDKVLSASRGPS